MKTITIFQKEDIKKFKDIAGYFLEGKGGVFNMNGLPMYDFGFDSNDDFIRMSELFEAKGHELNEELKTFLINEKDDYRKEIEAARKKIENYLSRLDELEEALKKANSNKSFMETFVQITQE